MSIGMGPWPRACRVINTLRTSSRTSWKFERREACRTRWVCRASSVMPLCTSSTFKLSLTSSPDSALCRPSSTSNSSKAACGCPPAKHTAVPRFLARTRPAAVAMRRRPQCHPRAPTASAHPPGAPVQLSTEELACPGPCGSCAVCHVHGSPRTNRSFRRLSMAPQQAANFNVNDFQLVSRPSNDTVLPSSRGPTLGVLYSRW